MKVVPLDAPLGARIEGIRWEDASKNVHIEEEVFSQQDRALCDCTGPGPEGARPEAPRSSGCH